jgi:hypothetical protein
MKRDFGNSVSNFNVVTRRLDLIDFPENSLPSLKLDSVLQSNGYYSVQVIRLFSLIHVIGA